MADGIRAGDGTTRVVKALIAGLIFLFVALSVFSYEWRDIALLAAPNSAATRNLVGPVGAWVAFLLFMTLGVSAYLLPFLGLACALMMILRQDGRGWSRIVWLAVLALSATALCDLYGVVWSETCKKLNVAESGGVLGCLLMRGWLMKWFGTGAIIFAWTVFVVSVVAFVGVSAIRKGSVYAIWISGLAIEKSRDAWNRRLDRQQLIEREQKQIERQKRRLERIVRKRPAQSGVEPVTDVEPEAMSEPAEEEPALPERPRERPRQRPAERVPDTGAAPVRDAEVSQSEYSLPPTDILPPSTPEASRGIKTDTATASKILVETLADFGIETQVVNVEKGPVVTRYEVLPAPGVRVERISSLSNNLALSLKASSVRVQAPIPGKGVVGIEIPNSAATIVCLRDILEGEAWKNSDETLPLLLGKDVGGNDLIADLADMPHMLVAGATGSGKTVCINSILAGLLMSRTPAELRLLLVDPKLVELSAYSSIPHLVAPVITDPKKVAIGLRWAINEMEARYRLFARVGVRNIEGYNSKGLQSAKPVVPSADTQEGKYDEPPATLPYVVIVVDELADLMLADQAEIENCIARLAQLSRAIGIHMILSTQRPSVNVITGTIKANFPSRIAFQVAQKVDSRTILDTIGAEKLLGRGDMLFMPPGSSKLIRAQAALTTDQDVQTIVRYLRTQGEPVFELDIKEKGKQSETGFEEEADEEMVQQAMQIIRETQRASTSSLQRRLRIGYTRAGRIMDVLEQRGIVGPPRGSDPREILVDLDGEIPTGTANDEV